MNVAFFKKGFGVAMMAGALSLTHTPALASDHDDGVSRIKTRDRNLTDLYVFREDNQTGRSADSGNLILVMNSDPRAPAGRQEFFSPGATYDFHISQIANDQKNSTPTGAEDVVLRFSFGAPDMTGHQTVTLRAFHKAYSENGRGGVSDLVANSARTTTLAESQAGKIQINRFTFTDGETVDVFAGLREDPFFFDVDQFLKVRVAALAGKKIGFRSPQTAVDFTTGLNVNTIVARVPIALLQLGKPGARIFDVWETVSVGGKQIERLARPAVNEGLVESNGFLNAFNMIPPSADLSAEAAPVRAQVARTLTAFDALDGKIDTTVAGIVAAFLPDVMRIDTRVSIPVGKTAYNADLSGDKKILTGGRKLQDDVMDITLSLLVAGDATGMVVKDNVSYKGTPGNRNQGHSLLNGQKADNGSATFPFLAKPN